MQYGDAVVVLEGMIKALESHIELAQKGLIEEDCIGCREKDLETYKGILEILQKEHNDKNGWICLVAECRLATDKLNKALEIIEDLIYVDENNQVRLKPKDKTLTATESLDEEKAVLLKEVFELCQDSKIVK